MYNCLEVWEAEQVLHVVLQEKPKNVDDSYSMQLSQELKTIAREISLKDDIKVIVLGAKGSDFSFGASPLQLADETADEAYAPIALASEAIEEWAKLSLPVLAALNGHCSSLGLALACVADIRYASEKSFFSIPEAELGLVPAGGITQRLPRLIGKGPAMSMLLGGDTVQVERAFQIGLVNKVVSEDALWNEVCQEAKRLANLSTLSMQYTKECLLRGSEVPFDQALRIELDIYMLLQTSSDRMEGVQAFLEKRSPQFIGK